MPNAGVFLSDENSKKGRKYYDQAGLPRMAKRPPVFWRILFLLLDFYFIIMGEFRCWIWIYVLNLQFKLNVETQVYYFCFLRWQSTLKVLLQSQSPKNCNNPTFAILHRSLNHRFDYFFRLSVLHCFRKGVMHHQS